MGRPLRYSLRMLGALVAAATFYANIFTLLPTNPNYEAAWWKVGLALIAFIAFCVWAYEVAQEPSP